MKEMVYLTGKLGYLFSLMLVLLGLQFMAAGCYSVHVGKECVGCADAGEEKYATSGCQECMESSSNSSVAGAFRACLEDEGALE